MKDSSTNILTIIGYAYSNYSKTAGLKRSFYEILIKDVNKWKLKANFVGRISSENKLNGSGESGVGNGEKLKKNYKIFLSNSTMALNRVRSNDPVLAMLKAKLKGSS